MEKLNKYITELLTLEIKNVITYTSKTGAVYENREDIPKGETFNKANFALDISKYAQTSDYDYQLNLLKEDAINEIIQYSEDTKKSARNRVESIRSSLNVIEDLINDIYSNEQKGRYSVSLDLDFRHALQNTFITPPYNQRDFDATFLSNLRGAILIKTHSIVQFVAEINRMLPKQSHIDNPKYSSLEVVDYNQWWLGFISDCFNEQLKPKLYKPEHVSGVYTQKDMLKKYQIENYLIYSHIPVFNFFEFRIAVRDLLITSRNVKETKDFLAISFKLAEEIIDKYNDFIVNLEKGLNVDGTSNVDELPPDMRGCLITSYRKMIRITPDRRKLYITSAGERSFQRQKPDFYLNHMLAKFAVNVYNFLNKEVFEEGEGMPEKNTEEPPINIFEDLFYDPSQSKPALEILKQLDPPILDPQGRFIGSPMSIICVWLIELKNAGIIKKRSDSEYTTILNNTIPKLNIKNASLFRKHSVKAEMQRGEIKRLVSQLSQM